MLLFLLKIADEQYHSQIERTYYRYHEKMLRVALQCFVKAKRNNPESDAEDAVQSAFLSIVRYAHVVPFDKQEGELKAYVFSILHNEISKILAEPELSSDIDIENIADLESLRDLSEQINVQERYKEVVLAIRDMDPKYSTVLFLYYVRELSAERLAKVLGVSKNTVYTRLRRGKMQLIDRFSKEDFQ